jgi:hypothetical protein
VVDLASRLQPAAAPAQGSQRGHSLPDGQGGKASCDKRRDAGGDRPPGRRLSQQLAIAERHPDVRACRSDNVIFRAGGDRVLPMPRLDTLSLEQADALVTQLRGFLVAGR